MPRVHRIILTIVVCAAGTLVGAFFGLLGGVPYAGPDIKVPLIGHWIGGAAGLLAGIVWCAVMTRMTAGGLRRGVVRAGFWLGIAAGVVATLILHVGLMMAAGHWTYVGIGIGLPCGVVAGAVTGLICGAIWAGVASRADRGSEHE